MTKRSENNLIDFLANFSAIYECATPIQMELLLAELDTRCLKVANRFLGQWVAFSSQIPSSDRLMKKEIINLCPVCFKQGKKTYMEADKGDDVAKCAVHGVISIKYFNDIFINKSGV